MAGRFAEQDGRTGRRQAKPVPVDKHDFEDWHGVRVAISRAELQFVKP